MGWNEFCGSAVGLTLCAARFPLLLYSEKGYRESQGLSRCVDLLSIVKFILYSYILDPSFYFFYFLKTIGPNS